jgi:hypothetical protein
MIFNVERALGVVQNSFNCQFLIEKKPKFVSGAVCLQSLNHSIAGAELVKYDR